MKGKRRKEIAPFNVARRLAGANRAVNPLTLLDFPHGPIYLGAPMPTIRDVVQALSKRAGVDAVLVLGRDGLPIDSVCGNGIDPDGVSALVPSVVEAVNQLGRAGQRGDLSMGVMECRGGFIIVSNLAAEALLAIFVRPDTNIGLLLFELRRYQSAIAGLL